MKESAIQAKIMKHLEARGFVTMKTLVMNRSGIPDILACCPRGRLWGIEVKTFTGKASKLQEVWIRRLQDNNAVAFIAFGYEDYLVKYDKATVL